MMEMEQKAGSFLAQGQTAVRTVLPPSTRGVLSELLSRFQGEGVRYKAKLIGMDEVPDAQGDKMCWDSMMKLKGIEVAGRRQGKHKQRVWLKVFSSGLKILDERTGAVLYDHDRSRISSLQKDESDPRALSYVYQHEDTYILFYIRTATLADPVLADIATVCRGVEHETPQEHPQAPTQTSPPLLPNDISAPPAEGPALENIFGPPDSSSGPSHQCFLFLCLQASSTNELMEIFSPQTEATLVPCQSPGSSQPVASAWILTHCWTWSTLSIIKTSLKANMGESVDVKALRARFNNKASTSDTSSRDSGSPKSPRPGFGRAILPVTDNDLAHQRLSPIVPPPAMAGPGIMRFPRVEPVAAPVPARPVAFPRPPPNPGVRPSIQPADATKVKQTGEMLQNIMLRHPRPPGIRPALAPVPAQAHALAHSSTPPPLRQQPRQRSTGEVTPLRKHLPPEGPLPLKPKRPPNVNLEPYKKFRRGPALPAPRKQDTGSPGPVSRNMSSPAVSSPPKPPQRPNKPSSLQRQVASLDIDDDQDTYDDIASFDKNESWSDNSSQCMDGDDEDVYESIDEDQVDVNRMNAEKSNKKEAKKRQEQEKKEQMERRKKENELKKNFQLQGEVEVLHTARVRHDWNGGGKLDLSVRQGESVEILRVKNNPGGKWLARSLNGNYGYISNTCVDVDYEAVKRKVLESRKLDTSPLPPPPPDPPLMLNVESYNRDSMLEDDDSYDDVQPLPEDFPPPPPEISIDPKVRKELKKKFKYEGPLKVLHTMMVDPNCVIKKPDKNYLQVTQGEILDIIDLTSVKKALCRNQFGKYGYVSRSLLLPMEGDIYDDVDYPGDIYDNDSSHTDH
ncbi:FYN-binding protein 1 isoform X6 [Acanthopagrus latus]|uniref:FYN-binding protein 1 isoform X6 n=1 Tax=Acanthopagrus latus TaxID=8177 RepID=UPI00187C79C3|nr:FYN-binding protein 1 isoform X6 [Acanthopagrus latus]